MKCKYCDNDELGLNDNFCPRCGKKIGSSESFSRGPVSRGEYFRILALAVFVGLNLQVLVFSLVASVTRSIFLASLVSTATTLYLCSKWWGTTLTSRLDDVGLYEDETFRRVFGWAVVAILVSSLIPIFLPLCYLVFIGILVWVGLAEPKNGD